MHQAAKSAQSLWYAQPGQITLAVYRLLERLDVAARHRATSPWR
jgi:hypothetical protein